MNYSAESNHPVKFLLCFPFLSKIVWRTIKRLLHYVISLPISYFHEILNLKIVVKLSFRNKIIFSFHSDLIT